MADRKDHGASAITIIAERMLARMPDHPAAQKLHAEARRLKSGAELLDALRSKRDPSITPAKHAMNVAESARKLDRELTQMINRAGRATFDGIENAQKRIAEKVNLQPPANAEEIRKAVLAMDSKDRVKLVNRLVRENRAPELAAIVKEPGYLTGFEDEQLANFEKAILSTHAAEEMAEIASLEGLFEELNTGIATAGQLCKRVTSPSELAAIERAAAEADAAADAFKQALEGAPQ